MKFLPLHILKRTVRAGAMMTVVFLGFNACAEELKLWYRQPATNWHAALPVGNGRLGGLVFGGVASDLIQLNEDSVWSGHRFQADEPPVRAHLAEVRELLFAGKPAEAQALVESYMTMKPDPRYGAYQPLGDLRLDFILPDGEVSEYRRELDLDTAVTRTTFRIGKATFTREVFASLPDQVLVVRLTCNRGGRISLKAAMARETGATTRADSDTLILSGQCAEGGSTFRAYVKAMVKGGATIVSGDSLHINNADAVTLLVAANTDYYRPDPDQQCVTQLARASRKSADELCHQHVADHRALFRRVELDLGRTAAQELPTDERLRRIQGGMEDPGFDALYFQYGRYLLIACSRPGSLPANLQGLWNPLFKPPWFGDYTININFEMNYWPAEVANLSECHEPLFDLVEKLQPSARQTARERYGCRGTMLTTRTTPWLSNHLRGSGGLLWQEGMAWLCAHLWQHYQFTLDREFLARRAYPTMKAAAEFYEDYLVPHPKHGWLVAGPSTSPENNYLSADGRRVAIDMGATMTMQIVRELFDNCIRAAEILGTDEPFRENLVRLRDRLAPMQIGSDGRLLEWSEDFKEFEPGHRHTSHLYGLHPANLITLRGTPALAAAARKSLEGRLSHGGGYVGWSRAWLISFWTRLEEGDKAHLNLVALYSKSTFPNLFDNHWRQDGEVFQIDGNFGATAAIAEMLLQSHASEISLLPALPRMWPDGRVKGLRARGGVEVAIDWNGGKLTNALLKASRAFSGKIRYDNKVIELSLAPAETRKLTASDLHE